MSKWLLVFSHLELQYLASPATVQPQGTHPHFLLLFNLLCLNKFRMRLALYLYLIDYLPDIRGVMGQYLSFLPLRIGLGAAF